MMRLKVLVQVGSNFLGDYIVYSLVFNQEITNVI